MTETGIAADDPHGSPCRIARWLTYYAERQNGLPGTLNLDPDGQAWSTRKHALPGNAARDTFTYRTEHVSVTLINPMSLKDAKKWAQQTLNDFEARAHPDPLLNVHDDANHSDGGQITCKQVDRTKVDCTTVVTFSEDAYTYSTAPSGQVYVNYKADRVMWTERMQWLPALFVWHLDPFFPRAPKAPTYGGDKSFAGHALHRTRTIDSYPCGDTSNPCSMVPYSPGN